MVSKKIIFCAISNVSSGYCAEDCAYCAQSMKFGADIQRYAQKSIDTVIEEAKKAKANGALGFCLVTAGERLDGKKVEYVSALANAVKSNVPGLFIIACNGIADLKSLQELKKAGVDSYNHNLESAREFFPTLCSTHSWDARFETCQNALSAELMLCSGGIFGLGESAVNRDSFWASLKELNPQSIPLNFYHPNPALPIKHNSLSSVNEGFSIIRKTRELFPSSLVMVAGGRESFFGSRQSEIFDAGCNSIIVGDYLTSRGQDANIDTILVSSAGYDIETECPFH